MPFESTHRWSSPVDGSVFEDRRIVLLGFSTTIQLAQHFQMLLSGRFERPCDTFMHESKTFYTKLCMSPAESGLMCATQPCSDTGAFSCNDCYCCCRCTRTIKACGRQDTHWYSAPAVSRSTEYARAAPRNVSLEVSWKPELLTIEADRAAFALRYCVAPPDLLVIAKGVHDGYFDLYTRVPGNGTMVGRPEQLGPGYLREGWAAPVAEGSELDHLNHMRISTAQHAQRMRVAVARYAKLLDCLPPSTVVVWLTPYHSYKTEWLARLAKASRDVMLELFAAGALGNRSLLIDAWHLSVAPDAPTSPDGNHRRTPFQTTLWGLLRSAWLWRTHELRLRACDKRVCGRSRGGVSS